MIADGTPGAPGQPANGTAGPPRTGRPGLKAHDRPGTRRRARRAAEWGKNKYAGSWAEYLWHRLDAADFMNQAMLLAATLLLCAVPFFLVAAALSGRSAMPALTARLGLSQQAAADMGHLFTSSSATSNAVTGLSWAFFILAGIAAATAIQRLYQRVFGQDPRGPRDTLRAVVWLVLDSGRFALGTTVAPGFRASARRSCGGSSTSPRSSASGGSRCGSCWAGGSPGAGSIRAPSPPARSGWACWRSSRSSSAAWSSATTRNTGRSGVVFGLMSFFIAIGVVITLGAAVGLMWQDRGMSFGAAVRRLRRGS
jgi:membrane protein